MTLSTIWRSTAGVGRGQGAAHEGGPERQWPRCAGGAGGTEASAGSSPPGRRCPVRTGSSLAAVRHLLGDHPVDRVGQAGAARRRARVGSSQWSSTPASRIAMAASVPARARRPASVRLRSTARRSLVTSERARNPRSTRPSTTAVTVGLDRASRPASLEARWSPLATMTSSRYWGRVSSVQACSSMRATRTRARAASIRLPLLLGAPRALRPTRPLPLPW